MSLTAVSLYRCADFPRLITVIQLAYFLSTTLARVHQHLAITTLEVTVVGFAFCTLGTFICWWEKPSDVELPHVLELNTTMESILTQAGSCAAQRYRDTPLDFVSQHEWAGSLLWSYYVNILRQMGLFPNFHADRPVQRISSFDFPAPSSTTSLLGILCFAACYWASFFWAWGFNFPTKTEKILWQTAASLQVCLGVIAGGFEIYCWERHIDCQQILDPSATSTTEGVDAERSSRIHNRHARRSIRSIWNMPCNNSISKHPSLNIPLRSLVVTTPICAAYVLLRCFLLVEDVIGLRSLPNSAYQDVDWARFWPFQR